MEHEKDGVPIRSLAQDFGNPLKYLLKENPNYTVGDIDNMSDYDMLRIPGIGKRAVQEVRATILRLKGPPDYRVVWEYRVLDMSYGNLHDNLNALGAEGWEVVCKSDDPHELILKREKR